MTRHESAGQTPFSGRMSNNKAAPRRCVNTVDPRGLADWIGVD